LWLDAAVLSDWQRVARVARSYPNSYVLHFPNRLDLPGETLDHAVALYRELACGCMVIHQPMFDRHHDALLRLEPSLRLAVENHKLTPEGLTAWAERSPGLALDVEHVWKFTLRDGPLESLLVLVRNLLVGFGDKLRHVHMPGYWPGLDEHRPMYCSRDLVFPILSLLAGAGFEGQIVSEVNPAYQNANDLRMDVLLFETWRRLHDPLLAAAPASGDDDSRSATL
jgi:hypothetical protein